MMILTAICSIHQSMKHSGFTLIELMVTLAVAVILAMVTVPGFRSIIQNNRAVTQANELLSSMTLARSEAIKRATNVSICSVANPLPSPPACAASTTWSNGWIVFIDLNRNGAFNDNADTTLCEVDSANLPTEDCILRVNGAIDSNTTLSSTSNDVRYLPSGLVTAAATLTLTPDPCTGNNKYIIAINATGRGNSSASTCP